jgi:hypothetical protein
MLDMGCWCRFSGIDGGEARPTNTSVEKLAPKETR